MADFHKYVGVVRRSRGQFATAAAAYRAGERIEDRRTGEVFDFTRKRDVISAEILAPEGAPAWIFDRSELWNRVEERDNRKDNQLALTYELALPRELSRDDRRELVKSFIQDRCVSAGMVADIAIHEGMASDGINQPHAHIMLTMRHLGPEGFLGKAREWNPEFKNTKGGRGFVADVSPLVELRAKWAEYANRELERIGSSERIDHRSLAAQRAEALGQAEDPTLPAAQRQAAAIRAEKLDREPQRKLGPNVQAMERRGIETERAEQNREILARNAEREKLQRELDHLNRKLGLEPKRLEAPDPLRVATRSDPVKARAMAREKMAARLKEQAAGKAEDKRREKEWRAARAEATTTEAKRQKTRDTGKGGAGGDTAKPAPAKRTEKSKAQRREVMAARQRRQKEEKRRDFGRER